MNPENMDNLERLAIQMRRVKTERDIREEKAFEKYKHTLPQLKDVKIEWNTIDYKRREAGSDGSATAAE